MCKINNKNQINLYKLCAVAAVMAVLPVIAMPEGRLKRAAKATWNTIRPRTIRKKIVDLLSPAEYVAVPDNLFEDQDLRVKNPFYETTEKQNALYKPSKDFPYEEEPTDEESASSGEDQSANINNISAAINIVDEFHGEGSTIRGSKRKSGRLSKRDTIKGKGKLGSSSIVPTEDLPEDAMSLVGNTCVEIMELELRLTRCLRKNIDNSVRARIINIDHKYEQCIKNFEANLEELSLTKKEKKQAQAAIQEAVENYRTALKIVRGN